MTKFERQGAILRLVEQEQLSTQAEVTGALRAQGFDAVQATVSRDIAQLGLVKVRNGNGRLVYAMPGSGDLDRLDALTSALRRWVSGMKHAGQLLVIATPNGFAAPLAEVRLAYDVVLLAGSPRRLTLLLEPEIATESLIEVDGEQWTVADVRSALVPPQLICIYAD